MSIESSNPLDETDSAFEGLRETAKADLLAGILNNDLAWDRTSSDWYRFYDGCWQITDQVTVQAIIRTAISGLMPKGTSLTALRNMEGLLKMNLLVESWNGKRNLLPMKNGVLNMDDDTLSEHSPDNRFRWCLPFDFDPAADCPNTKEWLNEATCGCQESMDAIQAVMYFALVGGGAEAQKFLELIGPGGTGKSTLVRLMESLVGYGNHVTTDLKNLETNRFETSALYGKRLAIVNDSSAYGKEVSTLKAATGGDPLRYEQKNKQQGASFKFDGMVVIAANQPIQSNDYSSGLSRRRVPVNFTRPVTDTDRARWRPFGGLEYALKGELPGLLNWVLSLKKEGALVALGGINGDLSSIQREHLIETNKLAAWVDECCVIIPEVKIYTGGANSLPVDHLYPNYIQWCDESGIKALTVKNFGSNLEDLLKNILKEPVERLKKDRAGRAFVGVTLRVNGVHNDIPTPVTKTILL